MGRVLTILTLLAGAFFTLQAATWVFAPETAATTLQMAFLEGAGRSSQMGDTGAFFTVMGLFILFGVIRREPELFLAPIVLIFAAAFYRVISALFYDAPFLGPIILFEVVVGVILIAYRRKIAD